MIGHNVFRLRSLMASVMAITIAAVAGAGCGRTSPAEEDAAPAKRVTDVSFNAEQIAHGGVQWAAVSAVPMAEFSELPGRLVLDEDHTARLSAPARGRVVAVRANVGDAVRSGQVLVVLQSEDAAVRRADLAKASADVTERQAALRYARGARERAERLLALKSASVQDVERARTDEAAAEAGVAQAQAAVDQAHAALSVLQVEAVTGQIQLTSPFSGVVVARDITIGAVVDAGAPAFVVTEPDALWLQFGASESVAARLVAGRRLPFTVAGLDGAFDARILRVSGTVDATTRLVTVDAGVANTDRRLRSGMFVTVRAETSASRSTITLPHDAVQLLDERTVVFLSRPDGKGGATFTHREVEAGATVDARTPILSGLTAGEVVVTGGAFAVRSQFSRGTTPAGE